MANAGEIREPDTAAHHIVSATSPDSQDARDILEKSMLDKAKADRDYQYKKSGKKHIKLFYYWWTSFS